MGKFFLSKSDRGKHVWFGFLIGLFTSIVGSTIVGLFVEVYDKQKGGKFDALDWVATIIGGVISTIVWAAIYTIWYFGGIWAVVGTFVVTPAFIGLFGALIEDDGLMWVPRVMKELTIDLLKEKFK